MRKPHLFSRYLMVVLVLAPSFFAVPASADHILGRVNRLIGEATYQGKEPATGQDCAVEELAENIDWLEHHIDTYGSIVAKQPDVWGDARLTKYRDEYERILYRELTNFNDKINASISQSDSSFLAQALALSSAASGQAPAAGTTTTTTGTAAPNPVSAQTTALSTTVSSASTLNGLFTGTPPATAINTANGTLPTIGVAGATNVGLEPVVHLDELARYLQHLDELRRINEGDDTSRSPGYSLNLVRIPVSILPGKLTRTGFGAEITITATPVISDDLLPTTFHNLAVNDVVDVLGLPLVRATEANAAGNFKYTEAASVFQKQVRAIKAALASKKGDDQVYAVEAAVAEMKKNATLQNNITELLKAAAGEQCTSSSDETLHIGADESHRHDPNTESAISRLRPAIAAYRSNLVKAAGAQINNSRQRNTGPSVPDNDEKLANDTTNKHLCDLLNAFQKPGTHDVAVLIIQDIVGLPTLVQQLFADLQTQENHEAIVVVPTGRARRALEPLNPTSVTSVIGFENILKIADKFDPAYNGRYIRWNGGAGCKEDDKNNAEVRVDLLDAQRFLQAELEAAYQLLSEPEHVNLFTAFAAPNSGLARQIHAGHLDDRCPAPNVQQLRHNFFQRLHQCGGCMAVSAQPVQPMFGSPSLDAVQLPTPTMVVNEATGQTIVGSDEAEEALNPVEALSWALVVEAALLNDRLNLDVRKIATAKDVPDLNTQRDYLFFLPETVNAPTSGLEYLRPEFHEATEVFKRYVAALADPRFRHRPARTGPECGRYVGPPARNAVRTGDRLRQRTGRRQFADPLLPRSANAD